MLPGDEQMLTIAEDMEANGCTLAGGLLFVLVQNLYHQGSSPPDGFHIMAFRLQATRVSTYIGCLSQDDFKPRVFTCLADHINWICCKFVVILPHWIIQSQHHGFPPFKRHQLADTWGNWSSYACHYDNAALGSAAPKLLRKTRMVGVHESSCGCFRK